MPDREFSEIMQVYATIGRGKSKFLDCLYLVRQGYIVEKNARFGKIGYATNMVF